MVRPVTLLPTRPAWVLMGVLFTAVSVLVISTTLLPAASGARTSWPVRLTDVLALVSGAVSLVFSRRLPRAVLAPFTHLGTVLITVCPTASGGQSTAVAHACTYLVATVYARFVMSRRQADLHFVPPGQSARPGARAVAEGIEEEAQAQWLHAHGCDLARGRLFSPAVPGDRLTAMLFAALTAAPAGTERVAS